MPRWHIDDEVNKVFEKLFKSLDFWEKNTSRHTAVFFVPFFADEKMILWQTGGPMEIGTGVNFGEKMKSLLSALVSSKNIYINNPRVHMDRDVGRSIFKLNEELRSRWHYLDRRYFLVVFPHSEDEPVFVSGDGEPWPAADLDVNLKDPLEDALKFRGS